MNEHRAAALAKLAANPNLTVLDGPADGTKPPPYVVVYVHVPGETRSKLEGVTDRTTITIVTHSVATTAIGAGIVARNVRAALLDQVLAVPGWRCRRISHEVGRAPDWDTTTGTKLMDAVDEWDYLTEPA